MCGRSTTVQYAIGLWGYAPGFDRYSSIAKLRGIAPSLLPLSEGRRPSAHQAAEPRHVSQALCGQIDRRATANVLAQLVQDRERVLDPVRLQANAVAGVSPAVSESNQDSLDLDQRDRKARAEAVAHLVGARCSGFAFPLPCLQTRSDLPASCSASC